MDHAATAKSVRKLVRAAYPLEPERVTLALRGLTAALDASCMIELHDTVRVGGKTVWAVRVQHPKPQRPAPDLAKILKDTGFSRVTNHTWAYPVPMATTNPGKVLGWWR